MNRGKLNGKRHVVTAADVTAGTIDFDFSDELHAVDGVIVQVDTAGVRKAWDGAYTISGGVVTVGNTGTTDWAANDVISVAAF